MYIKGELNKEVAKKVYRTYEQDGIFVVLDNDGIVGVEHDGKGYITDNVEELYEVFDKALIDYCIRQAMDVPICPVCKKPLTDRFALACPEHMPQKGETRTDNGFENLASAICVQAIRDYDRQLDNYMDHPYNFNTRDEMLRTEMWIRGEDWKVYTMGKIDPLKAIEARRKEAKRRWKKRQRARAKELAEKYCQSMVEEIESLNKKLEEYENSTAEGKSIKGEGKAI